MQLSIRELRSKPVELNTVRKREKELSAYRTCCDGEPNRTEVSEWLISIAMFIVGIHLLFFPQSLTKSHMYMVTDAIPLTVWAVVCMWIGIARVALILRAVTRKVLMARIALSIISACIWVEMVVAFLSRWLPDVPPPGLDMLIIVQVAGDIYVARRIYTHMKLLEAKGISK